MSEELVRRGLPARIPLGFGGLAQLVVLAATRPAPVAARPALGAVLAGGTACATFLGCGFASQRGISGTARLVWGVWGGFWAGFGFWLVSVPFSLVAPLPVGSVAIPIPAFVYPFPLTYRGFDVARDLAAVLYLSLSSGLTSGVAGLLLEARGGRENAAKAGDACGNDALGEGESDLRESETEK